MRFEAREIWREQVWLRVDPWVAAALAAVFCLLYALTLSCAPDEWDSVQFVFALDDFNLAKHHPHPPGYPLYVAAGWLVRALSGFDNHTSLALVSAMGGGGFVAALYLLMRLRVSREWALAGAVAAGFSPSCWLFSIKAMTDVSSSAWLMASIALASAACLERRVRLLYLAAITAAIASGFRPQNSFVLVILLVAATALGGLGWRRGLGAVAIWAVLCLAWLLPTMSLHATASHGDFWTAYWQANGAQFRWRFDQPAVYAGAALAKDPLLLIRLAQHLGVWVGFALGNVFSPWGWLLLPLWVGGWIGAIKILRVDKSEGSRRLVKFSLCWMAPYALMIFLFLPADARYYLPVLGPLAVMGMIGWTAWAPRWGTKVRWAALAIPVALFAISAPAAWQNHRESTPPVRAIRWMMQETPVGEQSSTLFITQESYRHAEYLRPGFQSVMPAEVRNPAGWQKAMAGIRRVYTDRADLAVVLGRPELSLVEVARFSRPYVIQFKNHETVIYRVEGW